MSATTKIFVSYSHSHKDEELFGELRDFLDTLKHLGGQLWVDVDEIQGGDKWNDEIEKGLAAADLAILVLSTGFLQSDFIRLHELPRLKARSDKEGIILYPVLLRTCPWEMVKTIERRQVRPKGLTALENMSPADRKQALTAIVLEIANLLESLIPPDAPRSIRLLSSTLLSGLEPGAKDEAAKQIICQVANETRRTGDALFDAIRFAVEYQLLFAEDPTSVAELLPTDAAFKRELASRVDVDRSSPIPVDPRFFFRTLDREDRWKAYFRALREPDIGGKAEAGVGSICRITVEHGYLAPQFLVAGLMSRFDEDWKPVIEGYTMGIGKRKILEGRFESLQLSQWICWLVWGPSIPLCTCDQWHDVSAYQYGFGDENNSIPVVDVSGEDRMAPIAARLAPENRQAIWTELTGVLRWGPWFLRDRPKEAVHDDDDDDPGRRRRPAPKGDLAAAGRHEAAEAQASLRAGGEHEERRHGGLIFALQGVAKTHEQQKLYYSAYLWLMFLVAVKGGDPAEGPGLLRGKTYPPLPQNARERDKLRDSRLWENLLPVFVHANIADPAAFKYHKLDLVEKSLSSLRQVWDSRGEMFEPADVEKGIQFHLVCGSDFTGCGCNVKFPAADPLVALLRDRLKAHAHEDFARAVVLPEPDDASAARPSALARYFSACHLPEMIQDYYTYIT